jgi:hypothetical protein
MLLSLSGWRSVYASPICSSTWSQGIWRESIWRQITRENVSAFSGMVISSPRGLPRARSSGQGSRTYVHFKV